MRLLETAEHLRLERRATGHYLRWTVVPPSESFTHSAIVANNAMAHLLARPIRRRLGARDRWLLVAPATFLALGWFDELAYHRRRAPYSEEIIHAVEHLAEGMIWTTIHADKLVDWRHQRNGRG